MAIQLSKNGNAIVFEFDDNSHYLNDGTIEVPVNSLTLVTDESDMFTFKKSNSDDIFISGLYEEIGMSKADLETFYKENMVGSTGGGGVTPEEVQDMIDESISGKADTSDVQEIASDVATVSGDVNTLSGSVNALTGSVNTLSGDVSTLSGAVDSNHNAITALNGDIQTLSGQVQGDETILTGHTANTDIHVTASDKQNWNNKSDFSGSYNDLTDKPTIPVVPTNVSAFNNDAGYVTQANIDAAVSGKVNTTDFNTYSASTDARLSEDEEVTSAALNALNSNKQDKLTAGENITINGNVISAAGGNNVIELTQAQYDALTDIDPDAFYIITDADGGATTGQVQTMIDHSISGKADTSAVTEAVSSKMDTSAFNIYSANTNARLSEDEEVTAAALTALDEKKLDISAYTPTDLSNYYTKSETSGATQISTALASKADKSEIPSLDGYATETWVEGKGYLTEHQDISGKLDVSAFNTYSGSVNTQLNSKASESDLNALNNTVTAHTADTVIHVTASDKQNWNNKSDFSGDYNDLTNKPTIPTVPTSNTAFTNDAGYITSVEAQTQIDNSISGKADTSAFTAHTADTTIHTTSAEKTVWNGAATNASNAITALGGLKLVQLTQAQYDALATKDASTLYFITGSN